MTCRIEKQWSAMVTTTQVDRHCMRSNGSRCQTCRASERVLFVLAAFIVGACDAPAGAPQGSSGAGGQGGTALGGGGGSSVGQSGRLIHVRGRFDVVSPYQTDIVEISHKVRAAIAIRDRNGRNTLGPWPDKTANAVASVERLTTALGACCCARERQTFGRGDASGGVARTRQGHGPGVWPWTRYGGNSVSRLQCGCKSTRLTCFKSTTLVRSRTASSRAPRHKFLRRRSTPSDERTMSASASSEKVL